MLELTFECFFHILSPFFTSAHTGKVSEHAKHTRQADAEALAEVVAWLISHACGNTFFPTSVHAFGEKIVDTLMFVQNVTHYPSRKPLLLVQGIRRSK